jgi:ribosomal protein S18 acetylase RimI-like enzyme
VTLLIRKATEEDIPIIVDFNQRLAEESEGKRLDSEIIGRGVKRALATPSLCQYYIAEHQGKVVGQTMITYEITDWRDGIAYWIQSVYVAQSHRGRGVFRSIYEHICEEARKAGDVRLIRLYVEVENEAAIATYEKLGLYRADYHMYEASI